MKEEGKAAGWPYEDIVKLPHHVSDRHVPMPLIRRAAQFAPFAALTGYEDAIDETARLTEEKILLTEEAADELNRKIQDALANGREVKIVYFVPDGKKSGGSYREAAGKIRSIKQGEILLQDGLRIPAGDVVGVIIR